MIELDFLQFHEQQYREKRYELYVRKNGLGDILYIGISKSNIWERWFGWGGHMTWDGKVIYGESPIGVKIENHLPESLNWKIQLWTLDDCVSFCNDMLPTRLNFTIQFLESFMIQKLTPILNVTYNLNPGKDRMSKSEREKKREDELDKIYKAVFENKSKKSMG